MYKPLDQATLQAQYEARLKRKNTTVKVFYNPELGHYITPEKHFDPLKGINRVSYNDLKEHMEEYPRKLGYNPSESEFDKEIESYLNDFSRHNAIANPEHK